MITDEGTSELHWSIQLDQPGKFSHQVRVYSKEQKALALADYALLKNGKTLAINLRLLVVVDPAKFAQK